jgi:CubicO group peptidase (beta-lactamase class C family)
MSELDLIITEAVDHKHLPFAVAVVANRSGVLWEGSAGQASPSKAAGADTFFRFFSMTKAIGSLAAMMMVDRGKVTLDTPMVEVMPELKRVQVLESIGSEGPVFRSPRRPITLRHLLTHTSGLNYGEWHAKMYQFHATPEFKHIFEGTRTAMEYPLMYDPGDDWAYGIGIDWAGRMVQELDGRTIDAFCHEDIFEPLGMRRTAFEAEFDRENLAQLVTRGPDGDFVPMEWGAPSHPEIYGMGSATYGVAGDYVRFLRAVLNRGELDGRRVISEEGIEPMLENQIGDMSVPAMRTTEPETYVDVELFPGHRKTHTAGFIRLEEDVPGMRRAGSLTWAGAANTHYWIDPAKDLTAVLMTQSLPFCDRRYMKVYDAFEREVYRQFG